MFKPSCDGEVYIRYRGRIQGKLFPFYIFFFHFMLVSYTFIKSLFYHFAVSILLSISLYSKSIWKIKHYSLITMKHIHVVTRNWCWLEWILSSSVSSTFRSPELRAQVSFLCWNMFVGYRCCHDRFTFSSSYPMCRVQANPTKKTRLFCLNLLKYMLLLVIR